jgi:signal transduction histidine kinase
MRLLNKTILYYLLAMIPLLAIAGFYLFNKFSDELDRRSDNELINDEIQWIRYIRAEAMNGTTFFLKTPDLAIFPVDLPAAELPTITDSYSYNPELNLNTPYRVLSHVVLINGINYQLMIRKSQEQKIVLVRNLTRMMLLVFAGLFIATLLFNWFISERLWKPFRASLNKMKTLELQKMEAVHFEETNTREFSELNASLNYMTGRMYRDYMNMKEFTENAAHEMQTPIAIVQSKLELLLQDSNLQREQADSIAQASEALNRLSKLNQGLLLLAKIENNQFQSVEQLNLTAVLEKYLQQFDELINDKSLHVSANLQTAFFARIHPFLADSLISNLLGNAIKYNIAGGALVIHSTDNSLTIENSGDFQALDTNTLFQRFHATTGKDDSSNGLGLAIVKKIADNNGLNVTYQYSNERHVFTIFKAN